jgi:hypothetical protein
MPDHRWYTTSWHVPRQQVFEDSLPLALPTSPQARVGSHTARDMPARRFESYWSSMHPSRASFNLFKVFQILFGRQQFGQCVNDVSLLVGDAPGGQCSPVATRSTIYPGSSKRVPTWLHLWMGSDIRRGRAGARTKMSFTIRVLVRGRKHDRAGTCGRDDNMVRGAEHGRAARSSLQERFRCRQAHVAWHASMPHSTESLL